MNYFSGLLIFSLVSVPLLLNAQDEFTNLNTPVSVTLRGISFSEISTGYACGDGGVIIRTDDHGNAWSVVTSGTSENLWDIKVIPGSSGEKVIAVGDNNTILKSTDNGNTWVHQTVPFAPGSFVFGIQCLDSLNYFACGGDFATFSGAILRTTNGGITWTKTAVVNSIFIDKVFMHDALSGFAAGTFQGFSDGGIHKIDGPSISLVKSTTSIITNIWCLDNNTIIAVGLGGQIWRSSDGGALWKSQSVNDVDLYGISFHDTTMGYACGGSSSGSSILVTTDGGQSWSSIAYDFTGAFQSVCITDQHIFIAGESGTVIRRSRATSAPEQAPLSFPVTVYPNPVSDILHIDVLGTDNLVTEIVNITGRRMIMSSSKDIDVNAFATGMYFYCMKNEAGNIATGSFVKQ